MKLQRYAREQYCISIFILPNHSLRHCPIETGIFPGIPYCLIAVCMDRQKYGVSWEQSVCVTEKNKEMLPKTHRYTLSYYKYKNEVGCRDDTVPKTVDTRRHCEEE